MYRIKLDTVTAVFRMTPCNLADRYQLTGGAHCLHLLQWKWKKFQNLKLVLQTKTHLPEHRIYTVLEQVSCQDNLGAK